MEFTPRKEPVIYVVEPYGGSIRKHSPSLPLIFVDDAAVTRGDGIFESLLVRGGKAANLDRHKERFAASARAMDLPDPMLDKWEQATAMAIADYTGAGNAGELVEAKCTWTYTRGRASTGRPSAWVVVGPIEESVLEQRAHGVKVMTTPRLWQVAQELPAKTLNYAAAMATLRLARSRGFEDVIFVDPDTGHVLEGTTSTVVVVKGDKLRTPAGRGILPGTTQAALFEAAAAQGFRAKSKEMTVDYLKGADSVWLVSSVRTAARVTQVDETVLPAPKNEAELRRLIAEAAAH
ncbi:aminodeoxychorismate lyase [Corynebacterium flavescens]|uniref:aminodeoxychorismate lyase n=1 Tax=Corynebacterium flavescens TaxID=28028 RepID=UPI003FD67EF5